MQFRKILPSAVEAIGLLILMCGTASAQPATAEILDETTLIEKPGCLRIVVKFTLPVRYAWHFPQSFGGELRIRIDPVTRSPDERAALEKREATLPRLTRGARLLGVELTEIAYEGDIVGGPYLTVRFRHAVAFRVGQGKDFRSIIIASPGPEASNSCKPELPAK